jgi:hypothetical protein
VDFTVPDVSSVNVDCANDTVCAVTIQGENGEEKTVILPKDSTGKVANVPLLIQDAGGQTFTLNEDMTIQSNKTIENAMESDIYISFNNIKYTSGKIINVGKGNRINLTAVDKNGITYKDSLLWTGNNILYNPTDTCVTYNRSNLTSSTGDTVSVRYKNDSCKVVIHVIDLSFDRCPEIGTFTNKYGFDEMSNSNKHISVASNNETFVKLKIQGSNDFSKLYFETDTNKVKIEKTNNPDIFKIKAYNYSKDTALVRVMSLSEKTKSLSNLTVCIYDEISINSANFYGVYKSGDLTTQPPNINTDSIKYWTNSYLKYQTAGINSILPLTYVPIDFDKNNNGFIDNYNDRNNPEIQAIRTHLSTIGATANSIVLIKDNIKDMWRLSDTVKIGSTTIKVAGSVNLLNLNHTYILSLPNGTLSEMFKIVSVNTATNEIGIDINPLLPENQGFTMEHPVIIGNDSISHCIISTVDVAGLSANFTANTSALIVGSTAKILGYIFAHEIMHAFGLADVDNNTNIMNYFVTPSTVNNVPFIPFTFKLQDSVVTGTNRRTGKSQNQWNDIR